MQASARTTRELLANGSREMRQANERPDEDASLSAPAFVRQNTPSLLTAISPEDKHGGPDRDHRRADWEASDALMDPTCTLQDVVRYRLRRLKQFKAAGGPVFGERRGC